MRHIFTWYSTICTRSSKFLWNKRYSYFRTKINFIFMYNLFIIWLSMSVWENFGRYMYSRLLILVFAVWDVQSGMSTSPALSALLASHLVCCDGLWLLFCFHISALTEPAKTVLVGHMVLFELCPLFFHFLI